MECELIFSPDIVEDRCETAKIVIYDADGEVANEATIGATHGNPITLELAPLMGGAKSESGLVHSHLAIEHSTTSRVFVRGHTRAGAAFLEPVNIVDQDHPAFFPVCLERAKISMISLVNLGDSDLTARVRLIISGRNPDVSVVIPARGSRVVSLEAEFGELAWGDSVGDGDREEKRGYVRTSIRGEGKIGVSSCSASQRGADGLMISGIGR